MGDTYREEGREVPCPAHGEMKEQLGYIRGRVDEIGRNVGKIEERLEDALFLSPAPPKPAPEESSAAKTLVGAIAALIVTAATLLGTLHLAHKPPDGAVAPAVSQPPAPTRAP